MPDLGSAFSSGVQGALAGSQFGSVLGIPGAAIGGGIGLLSGLFSDNPADLAKQRWENFKKSLQEMKTNTLTEGSRLIGNQTAAARASATAGGRRRAIASGRDTQAESFILPAVGQAETTGANALNNFTFDTNRQFDNAMIQANMGEMNLPLPAQPSEYFDVAANAVGTYGKNKKMYDMLENALSDNGSMKSKSTFPNTNELFQEENGLWNWRPK